MELATMLPTVCTGDYRVPAETIRSWARRSERAGFTGLWAIDHLVKPATYNSAVLDPTVALTYAAGVTDEIGLGTSILIFPLRRTANVASRALTLQHLSGGRFTLGLGAGYIPKEFEAVGVPLKERSPRFTEGLDVLQALFEGETSYDGRFHSFEDVQIDPVLDDPPRLIAGGDSNVDDDGERRIPEPILRRVVKAGGWIAPPSPPEKVRTEMAIISDYARDQGVDPDSIDRILLQYTHVSEADTIEEAHDEQRAVFEEYYSPQRGFDHALANCLVGTVEDINGQIETYEEIGFDEVIVGPAAHDPATLDEQMDLLTDRVLSHVD